MPEGISPETAARFGLGGGGGEEVTDNYSYLNALSGWLTLVVKKGLATPEEAQDTLHKAHQLIGQGAPLESLPYFSAIKDQTQAGELNRQLHVERLFQDKEQKEKVAGEWEKSLEKYSESRGIEKYLRDRDRIQAIMGDEERPGGVRFQRPPPPPAAKIYKAALEGRNLSPAQRKYFEYQGGELFEQFSEEQPDARRLWWETLNPPPQPAGDDLRGIAVEAQQALERSQGAAEWMMKNVPDVVQGYRTAQGALETYYEGQAKAQPGLIDKAARTMAEARTAAQGALIGPGQEGLGQPDPTPKPNDPWEEYLKNVDFQAKFYKMSPTETGMQTRRYKPPTRFGF
uniref:Uncharacterized protein n=1 Tax=viral metagenome TaxID=1070528 RepID=A0A6M3J2I6_9ZZZZ